MRILKEAGEIRHSLPACVGGKPSRSRHCVPQFPSFRDAASFRTHVSESRAITMSPMGLCAAVYRLAAGYVSDTAGSVVARIAHRVPKVPCRGVHAATRPDCALAFGIATQVFISRRAASRGGQGFVALAGSAISCVCALSRRRQMDRLRPVSRQSHATQIFEAHRVARTVGPHTARSTAPLYLKRRLSKRLCCR